MVRTSSARRGWQWGWLGVVVGLLVWWGGAARVQATSYHTLTIDGTNDFQADEDFATSTGGYTSYFTWDATDLFLGYSGADVGATESATKWMVWYFDTDPRFTPTTGLGTTNAIAFNTQDWTLPFNADYMLQVRSDEGFSQLNRWDGSAWVATGLNAQIFDNDGGNFIELRLPRSDLNNPTQLYALGYFVNEQGGGEFTYASWPAGSLSGGDGYKNPGSFTSWYGYDLVAGVAPDAAANLSRLLNPPVLNQNTGMGFATIQAALDHATTLAGHTIVVAPGTFSENVTINKNSITLRGAGAGTDPTLHTILNGPGIGTNPGIRIAVNVTGVTIEDLRVQNYTNQSGILGMNGNHFLTVRRVHVVNNGRAGFSDGGIYVNGPVTDVLIDQVTATNNRTRGIVVWNGFKQRITITNNTVTNNNCCGIELQDGTASGVTITGNTISNNTDSGIGLVGLMAGAGPNLIANNTLTDNGRFGIEVKLPNGTGLETGDGSIVVRNNTVSRTVAPTDLRDHAGIAVFRRSWVAGNNNVDIPLGVVVRDNTVSGYQQPSTSDGFGIVVEGLLMRVYNNTVSNNDVGIQQQAGHLPYTPNTNTDGNQNNLADQYFGRGNSPVVCAFIGTNSFSGNGADQRDVGTVGSPTVTNPARATTFCSIQSAIDHAATQNGDTIAIGADSYRENVVVTKELTLDGAGVLTTTLQPATSGPTCTSGAGSICPGGVNMILVQAANVTIREMTLDGDNPILTSGVVRSGADLDARNGIITDHTLGTPFNTLEVHDVAVRNIYLRAIYASSGGSFDFHDNSVQNVRGEPGSIGLFAFGGTGVFANNTVTDTLDGIAANHSEGIQFLNNSVTNSDSGIHTDNAGDGGGTADLLQGNTVSACTGITSYGVWIFVPHLAPTIQNNTVTNCTVGLGAFGQGAAVTSQFSGNTVDGGGLAGSYGAYLSTTLFGFGSTNNMVALSNNTIRNTETGVWLEEETGFSLSATVSALTLTNSSLVGIDQDGGTLTLANSSLTNPGGVGIGVDSNLTSTLTIGGAAGLNTHISGFGTGVRAAGSTTISHNDASILTNTTGIEISGGSATITNNDIRDNSDVGVLVTGGSATLHLNNIAGNGNFGVRNDTLTIVDATNNFWGSLNGPLDNTAVPDACGLTLDNPGGLGDRVSQCVDWGGPLAVRLDRFEAFPQGESVRVEWETLSEIDNAGFRLYRGTTAVAPDAPLHEGLIPSQAPGSGQGFSYEWLDETVETGATYYYWLEDVDTAGIVTRHGPVQATVQAPTAVTVGTLGSASGATPLLPWLTLGAALALALVAHHRRVVSSQ